MARARARPTARTRPRARPTFAEKRPPSVTLGFLRTEPVVVHGVPSRRHWHRHGPPRGRAAALRPPPATAPVSSSRSAATAATAGAEHHHAGSHRASGSTGGNKQLPRGDYVPVYVALGLIALSVTLGLHTARQQLAHAPNVWVDKKKRETVPEVAAPELALDEAERFVDRSLFRKVAHVQDDRSLAAGVADPVTKYPTKKAVTLKDVGVETPGIGQSKEGVLDKIFKKNPA
ncbi:unnamed protein product [Miscanthus lutarioriparius]|uniref:Uncharacterized protein n=1 Tax=Miscanthus lutarioriparius TaxID=422564 RepID=A0A811Q8Z7_9POAL|nr:unnamed protein product [Miscanthus lutarioriparius]